MRWVSLVALAGILVGACSGDDDDKADEDKPTGTTAAPAEPLRILVTNDDGVGGQGMSDLVDGLATLDDVEVDVAAPAEDKSGTGGQTSPTPISVDDVEEVALVGGAPAVAVPGFPADAVVFALENMLDEPPHLVVSGINKGQNLGPVAVRFSGTVGAARKAVSEGIPALAVSQGLTDGAYDYSTAVELTLDWIDEHRDALVAGDLPADAVANLNVPSCATGEMRGVVEVPTATADEGRDMIGGPSDCASTATDPKDDIDAFLTGYAPLADVAP
jgi:5'-nucleotidase